MRNFIIEELLSDGFAIKITKPLWSSMERLKQNRHSFQEVLH
jgi:hypothetical protein